eukprot:1247223-Alexandrium_andersonii.AAC.1
MSASLVGSEMCIRDRNDCGCAASALFPRRRRGRRNRPGSGLAEGGLRACLLYTSDAADDM